MILLPPGQPADQQISRPADQRISGVDVIAGDGSKACYLATSKAGGCPSYEVMTVWSTQPLSRGSRITARHHQFVWSMSFLAPTRISCFWRKRNQGRDLYRGVSQEDWRLWWLLHDVHMWVGTRKVRIWGGHQRFDDQDHMDYVGEFNFSVNETFWSCDHNIFMLHQRTLTRITNFLFIWSLLTWMGGETFLCTSTKEDSMQGTEEGYSEAEQAQGSRLWWWSLIGFIMGQLGWQINVGTRLQHWLWWFLIFVNKAMETEDNKMVLLCPVFLSADLLLHKMVHTLTAER